MWKGGDGGFGKGLVKETVKRERISIVKCVRDKNRIILQANFQSLGAAQLPPAARPADR